MLSDEEFQAVTKVGCFVAIVHIHRIDVSSNESQARRHGLMRLVMMYGTTVRQARTDHIRISGVHGATVGMKSSALTQAASSKHDLVPANDTPCSFTLR